MAGRREEGGGAPVGGAQTQPPFPPPFSRQSTRIHSIAQRLILSLVCVCVCVKYQDVYHWGDYIIWPIWEIIEKKLNCSQITTTFHNEYMIESFLSPIHFLDARQTQRERERERERENKTLDETISINFD